MIVSYYVKYWVFAKFFVRCSRRFQHNYAFSFTNIIINRTYLTKLMNFKFSNPIKDYYSIEVWTQILKHKQIIATVYLIMSSGIDRRLFQLYSYSSTGSVKTSRKPFHRYQYRYRDHHGVYSNNRDSIFLRLQIIINSAWILSAYFLGWSQTMLFKNTIGFMWQIEFDTSRVKFLFCIFECFLYLRTFLPF